MSNRIQDMIKKNIVEPSLRQKHYLTKGTVVHYDSITNRAHIRFNNPAGPETTTASSVPLHMGALGVHSAGPEPGSEVWMEFINGDPTMPRIVGFVDEHYSHNTRKKLSHIRKGAYIPDFLSEG